MLKPGIDLDEIGIHLAGESKAELEVVHLPPAVQIRSQL